MMDELQARVWREDGVIKVSMPLDSRRLRKRFTVKYEPADPRGRVLAQRAILVAIARGRCFARQLAEGKVTTLTELSGRLEEDASYVARIYRLSLLAPDIVDDLLAGREPEKLTLEALLKELPLAWSEQREVLGFPQPGAVHQDADPTEVPAVVQPAEVPPSGPEDEQPMQREAECSVTPPPPTTCYQPPKASQTNPNKEKPAGGRQLGLEF